MIRAIYEDFCKECNFQSNEQEYEVFLAGWYACRGAVLSVVDSLTDEEDETAH